MLPYVPLQTDCFFSIWIDFTHGMWRVCPFTDVRHHYVKNWDYCLQMTYRSMITLSTDIDHCILQLSSLMAAEKFSETHWLTRHVTSNGNDFYEYTIRSNQPEQWNSIPRSQFGTIISQRTYNHWLNDSDQNDIRRSEGDIDRQFWVSTVATSSLLILWSASTSFVVYTYNFSILQEAWRTAKLTEAMGRVSERQREETKLLILHFWTCRHHVCQF